MKLKGNIHEHSIQPSCCCFTLHKNVILTEVTQLLNTYCHIKS